VSALERRFRIESARRELCFALGLEPDGYTFAPVAVELLKPKDVPVRSVRCESDEDGMASIMFTA